MTLVRRMHVGDPRFWKLVDEQVKAGKGGPTVKELPQLGATQVTVSLGEQSFCLVGGMIQGLTAQSPTQVHIDVTRAPRVLMVEVGRYQAGVNPNQDFHFYWGGTVECFIGFRTDDLDHAFFCRSVDSDNHGHGSTHSTWGYVPWATLETLLKSPLPREKNEKLAYRFDAVRSGKTANFTLDDKTPQPFLLAGTLDEAFIRQVIEDALAYRTIILRLSAKKRGPRPSKNAAPTP